MKWICALVIAMVLSGCSVRTEYVDRPVEVKIPVACQIEMPKSPDVKADVEGLREILKYTEVLECAVKACRGEKCN